MDSTPRKRRVLKRVWVTTFLVLSASCAAAVYIVLHHYGLATSSTADQPDLIQSLAEPPSARNAKSPPIRVAVFQIEERDESPVEPFAEILESESTCTCEPVSPADVRAGALDRFDAVVFPGGSGSKQAAALGIEGKQAVREFVRAGGGCVGVCGGAFLATAKYDWSLALVNAGTMTGERNIPGLGMKSMASRGAGIAKMELTDAGRRVFGDFPGLLDVPYTGGPILSPAGRSDLPEYVALALFRTEIWQYEPQRGSMIDTPAIVAARFGKGKVILFSPHPEMTRGLEPLVRRAILAAARGSANAP
jgi:glutamine amidotransferase-like uncharacterized protein